MMPTRDKKMPKMKRGANDVIHLMGNLPPATSTDVCKLCAAETDSDEDLEEHDAHRNTPQNGDRSESATAAASSGTAADPTAMTESEQQTSNQEAQRGNELPETDSSRNMLSKVDLNKLQNLAQFNVTFYPHATRHALLNRAIKFNFRIPMAYPSTPPVIRCTSRWFLDSYSSYFQINPDDGRIKLAILQGNTSNGNYFGSRSSKGEEEIDAIGWLRTYNLASVAYALHQQLADPLKICTRLVTIGKNCMIHQQTRNADQPTRQDPISEQTKEPFLSWGQSEAKGRRPHMEDAMNAGIEVNIRNLMDLLRVGNNSTITPQRQAVMKDSNDTVERSAHLFGVYDGHGGSRVSEFIAEQMQKSLEESLSNITLKDCVQQHILSNNSTMWGDSLAKKENSLSPDFRLATAILHGLRRTFSSLDADYTKSLIEHAEKFASKMGTSATEAFGLGQSESDAPAVNADSIISSWPFPLPTVQDCKTASMLDGSGSTVCACVIVRPKGSTAGEIKSSGGSDESQQQSLSKKGIIQRNINRLIYREPLCVGATDFSLPLGQKTEYNFGQGEVDGAALSAASRAFENNDTSGFAVLAHAGDSRAVMAVKVADDTNDDSLGSKMIALELTHDHKADPGARPDETARIAAVGGAVMAGRVSGRLAVARAVGDPSLKWGVDTKTELKEGDITRKQTPVAEKVDTRFPPLLVTSDPELCLLPLDSTCCFLILACDGLWDVVTSQDAVNEVTAVIRDHENNGGNATDIHAPAAAASQKLVHLALEKGSMDNVSVSVVLLREPREIVNDSKDIPVSSAAVNIWTHYDAEEDIENPSATLLNNALQSNSKTPAKEPSSSSTSASKSMRRTSSTSSEQSSSDTHEPKSAHQPVGAPRNPANPFAGRRNKGAAKSKEAKDTATASKPNNADTVDASATYSQARSQSRTAQTESSTSNRDNIGKSATNTSNPSPRQGDAFRHSASRGLLGSQKSSTSEGRKKHDSLSALTLDTSSSASQHASKKKAPHSARSAAKSENLNGEDDTLDNLMAEVNQNYHGSSSEQRADSRASGSSTRRRSTPQLSGSMSVPPTYPMSQKNSHSRKAGRQYSQRNELSRFM